MHAMPGQDCAVEAEKPHFALLHSIVALSNYVTGSMRSKYVELGKWNEINQNLCFVSVYTTLCVFEYSSRGRKGRV